MNKLRILTGLILTIIISFSVNAQDLENIINKHLDAINAEKRSELSTLTLKGSLTQQGMQMELEMYEKAPDKMKVISRFSEMEIVQVVNGDKGYIINPMMGSSEPIPLNENQISSTRKNSMLKTGILNDYREGKLELMGEEMLEGSPAYKIRASDENGERFIFIDKDSYYITGMQMTMVQMNNEITLEMRMSDFNTTDGITIPRTIKTFTNGQLAGTATYDNIEFNIALDDSIFEIK